MTQARDRRPMALADAPLVPVETVPRGRGSLLLSLGRLRSLVIEGLPPAQEQAVRRLGATSSIHLRAVARHPSTPKGTAEVLSLLARAAESAALAPAVTGCVVVAGHGALADGIRGVVRGYTHHLTDDARPPADGEGPPYQRPDLVLLVTDESLDLRLSERWRAQDVPVLPVVTRAERVVVGPVLGQPGGPCARCIELYRCDRDPGRPAMLASVGTPRGAPPPDPAVAAIAAGVAGLLVRGLVTNTPLPVGLGLSIEAPFPRIEHHVWRQHPGCPCTDALG